MKACVFVPHVTSFLSLDSALAPRVGHEMNSAACAAVEPKQWFRCVYIIYFIFVCPTHQTSLELTTFCIEFNQEEEHRKWKTMWLNPQALWNLDHLDLCGTDKQYRASSNASAISMIHQLVGFVIHWRTRPPGCARLPELFDTLQLGSLKVGVRYPKSWWLCVLNSAVVRWFDGQISNPTKPTNPTRYRPPAVVRYPNQHTVQQLVAR